MDQQILQIPIEDIIPNRFQPRLSFDSDSLKELAESIKEYGVIQPLVLRRVDEKYEIVAGERRYKAARLAGLLSIPAIISTISDEKSAEIAIVENVQRRDLTAIEEAKSYQSILDKGNVSQEELSKRLGLSQSSISNKLRLLTLAEAVQEAVINGEISERHARSLLKVASADDQRTLLKKIITERLTVKKLEEKNNNNYKKVSLNNIMTIEELEEEMPEIKLIKDEKPPNKFFNFLESEELNLETEEPKYHSPQSHQIEFLDFEVKKENKTLKEIETHLRNYENIEIKKETKENKTILTIIIKDEE